MRTSLLHRLETSPVGKTVFAALVFCLVLGGWMSVRYYREATATLPDDQTQQSSCSLWFVGTSSMFRWASLHDDMAPWIAHNRGINDATYADILPRFANSGGEARPAAIILYAGENDIARGVPVRTVIHDLAKFLEIRSRFMGDVPVIILSMKPSPTRWPNFQEQQIFNAAAQRLLPHVRSAYYADITTPLLKGGMLGDNYRPDGVHMNAGGYQIWAKVIRQRLREALSRETLHRCEPG